MKPSEKIINFLKNHPLISVSGLEKQCGMYPRDLHKAINGDRDIPEKYINTLAEILKDYGLKNK